jgi:hypothetical protein
LKWKIIEKFLKFIKKIFYGNFHTKKSCIKIFLLTLSLSPSSTAITIKIKFNLTQIAINAQNLKPAALKCLSSHSQFHFFGLNSIKRKLTLSIEGENQQKPELFKCLDIFACE